MRPHFPSVSPLSLLDGLARSDAPVLLDIRLPEDIDDPAARLPGAIAVAHDDWATLRAAPTDSGAVVICHKGLKLSAGVTARLRAHGIPASRLSGGHVGWIDADLPLADGPAKPCLALPMDATATETAKVWAAKRFHSPRADILCVPRADLDGVIARFDAGLPAIPALPGLPRLRAELSATPLFALQLAGNALPVEAFAHIDAAYRGILRDMFHETFMPTVPSGAIPAGQETPA